MDSYGPYGIALLSAVGCLFFEWILWVSWDSVIGIVYYCAAGILDGCNQTAMKIHKVGYMQRAWCFTHSTRTSPLTIIRQEKKGSKAAGHGVD